MLFDLDLVIYLVLNLRCLFEIIKLDLDLD